MRLHDRGHRAHESSQRCFRKSFSKTNDNALGYSNHLFMRAGPVEDPLAGDLHHPHDAARDWHLDVVAASPDGQARPAPPRERSPPPLASRHCHSDQYFATGAGPLGGGAAGRRAARGAIAEDVSFTANTVSAIGCNSSCKALTVPKTLPFSVRIAICFSPANLRTPTSLNLCHQTKCRQTTASLAFCFRCCYTACNPATSFRRANELDR